MVQFWYTKLNLIIVWVPLQIPVCWQTDERVSVCDQIDSETIAGWLPRY